MTYPVSLQSTPNWGGNVVTIVSCERADEYDYVVRLKRPNGVEIEILVPVADEDRFVDVGRPSGPFGLNLVCSGHYT